MPLLGEPDYQAGIRYRGELAGRGGRDDSRHEHGHKHGHYPGDKRGNEYRGIGDSDDAG